MQKNYIDIEAKLLAQAFLFVAAVNKLPYEKQALLKHDKLKK